MAQKLEEKINNDRLKTEKEGEEKEQSSSEDSSSSSDVSSEERKEKERESFHEQIKIARYQSIIILCFWLSTHVGAVDIANILLDQDPIIKIFVALVYLKGEVTNQSNNLGVAKINISSIYDSGSNLKRREPLIAKLSSKISESKESEFSGGDEEK